MIRLALVAALLAAVLSGAALAVAPTRPAGERWPLVCSQTFTSQGGQPEPIYYPCGPARTP
jgi:hypothetical protein